MGWLISITMLVSGCVTHSDALVISSGLFAIAGSLGSISLNIKHKN